VATALAGSAAAFHYAQAGLALSHYDARAHLVVARRILDSLMPGWQQVGAVWLPLPHLLNMLPVQVDAWYRTGASATALSIAGMSLGAWALAAFVLQRTASVSAAIAGAVLLTINPNVLYLESTPMTEPLLFGTTLLAVLVTANWVDAGAPAQRHVPGLAIVAACMTRYEAWPICAMLLVLAWLVLVRRGTPAGTATTHLARLAVYPAIAILLFLANSRWTTGYWFISSGFFVAENPAAGDALIAWDQVRDGVYRLSSTLTVWSLYVGAAAIVIAFAWSRAQASLVLVLALTASAALPWYAYYEGHPFRVRYGIPLVVASAAIAATAIGLLPRRLRLVSAALIVGATLSQVSPLDRSALMILEAQRDAQNMAGRRAVTSYLVQHWNGRPIMMSMGSLAHYMHDLSREGFNVHDFLQEGNGEVWVAAMDYGPAAYVEWVAIEEQAEGGDALFHRASRWPEFLKGFDRVAEGGGVALYRATPRTR
jgi:hypothetical protein